MSPDIDQMLNLMDWSFQCLEEGMPHKPKSVTLSFGYAYRYIEKNIYQAIILKLARTQSSVRAAKHLLEGGFVQEQAILHRIIDETNEDILFLVYAVTNDEVTDLHNKFLDAFWEEEIDGSGTVVSSAQKRPMIPRNKIRAYITKVDGVGGDTSRQLEVMRSISKMYSGFVHGAAPQIMDMYIGNPPRFHTAGMHGTIRMEEHSDDLWNYVYRSYLSHIYASKAFGAEEIANDLLEPLKKFQQNSGQW